jgi:hypothetical protein
MNRYALSAIALTCLAVPRAALADGALAPTASSNHANEAPPPPEMVETEESHMRSPSTAAAGGVLLGLGVIGIGAGVGVFIAGAKHSGLDALGDGIVGMSLIGGVGHLVIPGSIMLGIGASRVHGKRMAYEPPPTIDLAITPTGGALRATF